MPYFKTHVSKIRDAINTVGMYRDAVGDDVDLCIEIHRRLTPAEAIVLARGIEEFHPFFYEDPILPENFDAMGLVANQISIPIATGERFHSIHEFAMLLKRGAVQYVRPDVCMAGGLTHSKKIAALAEANYVGVVPHNPLSPVSTAACLRSSPVTASEALPDTLPVFTVASIGSSHSTPWSTGDQGPRRAWVLRGDRWLGAGGDVPGVRDAAHRVAVGTRGPGPTDPRSVGPILAGGGRVSSSWHAVLRGWVHPGAPARKPT